MRLLPHGMKIGNATVIVDIVPKGNLEIRPGIPMKARGITDHDTGNSGRGADAKAHNKLLHNWGKLPVKDTSHISWHGSIDEDFIIQHIPFDEPAYHCGDGWGLSSGNRNTIGFEKCMHQGANRTKIEENTIALYAYLMREMKFPIDWIRPHQYWSGKYCPQLILNKYGSFLPFRNKIESAFKGGVVQVSSPRKDYFIIGDKEPGVGTLQTKLNKVGFKVSVDNIFGTGTENAVKAFQRSNGLLEDGVAGKATLAKLDIIIANIEKKPPRSKPIAKPESEDGGLVLPQWQRKELAAIYRKAREIDVFSSEEHEQAILDGTMPIEQIIFLQTLIAGAALNEGKRIKVKK